MSKTGLPSVTSTSLLSPVTRIGCEFALFCFVFVERVLRVILAGSS